MEPKFTNWVQVHQWSHLHKGEGEARQKKNTSFTCIHVWEDAAAHRHNRNARQCDLLALFGSLQRHRRTHYVARDAIHRPADIQEMNWKWPADSYTEAGSECLRPE